MKKYNSWKEVLQDNYVALMEEAVKVGKEAVRNNDLRYIVQINADGEIDSWHDVAGGNSTRTDVFNGEAIEVFNICYQYLEECEYFNADLVEQGGLTIEESMDEFIEDVEVNSYIAILDAEIYDKANAEF